MSSTFTNTNQNRDAAFAVEVRVISHRVRLALTSLTSAVRVDASKPRTLARDLGVDKTLAWKVSRIVTDPNPLAAMTLVPGKSAQRILLDSFGRAGADQQLVEQARVALDEFDRMVRTHADDRETFEMMLSSVSDAGQPELEEAQRKVAYQGNSAIWGVQARVRFCAYIACPNDDPNFGTTAVVGGFVDFRRLRANMPWTLATGIWMDTDGRPMSEQPAVPLDPEVSGVEAIPLLREYCSPNLPPIHRTRRADGAAQYQFTEGEVGNTGLFTCVTGWKHPRIPKWRSEHDQTSEFSVGVSTPVELLQLDLLVHRASWPPFSPALHVFSLLPGEAPYTIPGRTRPEIPVRERVTPLGEGLFDLDVFDIPNYGRMIESTMARLGHTPSEFVGYRVRVKYPILCSNVAMLHPMPERP